MDFAKQQLEKFGWKEGSGLGRNGNGISEALKPKMKFDSSGLGHTRSDEFTYKWWDHAFNKAASSFNVVVNENEAVVVRTDDADVKGAIKAKLGKISTTGEYTYGFHKAGTLKNGEEEMNEVPTIVEEKDYSLKLSDEELFKLCGGRTAHKGARHGHRFSGKLARIAKQEALLLASMNNPAPPTPPASKTTSPETIEENTDEPVPKKKKKKKTKECGEELQKEDSSENKIEKENKEINPPAICTVTNEEVIETQKPKKKKKKDLTAPEETLDLPAAVDASELTTKKKKKKKDKLVNKDDDLPVEPQIDAEVKSKKSKKRKRNDVEL